MLPPDYLIDNLGQIEILYADLHTSVLESIAKHVADALLVEGQTGMMPSTKRQIEAAMESGLLREEIMSHIALTLQFSREEVKRLFDDAGLTAIRFDNRVYRQAGLAPIDITRSPVMLRMIDAGVSKHMGTLERLTGTTAINAEEMFNRTLNLAYNKALMGTHSYTEAVESACGALFQEGVTSFSYASGRNISIEAAVLMNIRTGIAQTAAEITRQGMVKSGASYVQTTAHGGARPSHVVWQGKPFYYREIATEPNGAGLPDFVIVTQYGDVAGLCGANCRHSFGPWYPGISASIYTQKELEAMDGKTVSATGADGKKRTMSVYEATQRLRYLERGLRHWKRRASVREAAGLDSASERRKAREWSQRIKIFAEETGLKRQGARERIAK